jgi:hypothetical protein
MFRALASGAVVAVLAVIGCKSGADSSDDPGLEVTSETSKGSARGFSASLGAELGMGSAAPESASESGSGSGSGSGSLAPVAVAADLAAIKLMLLPGWERDVGEGGTFSRSVNIERTGQPALFKFHYGYEDPRAPVERDAYKKFLTESQILRVLNDRQRGTAWLLEGKDAFRMVVVYDGKRLVCWGSHYKGSLLGEVRDEVVTQARNICESISL